MVGPSLTDDERDAANTRLKIGFVLLVAASGGMVALQTGGTPVQLVGGTVGGTVVGLVLLWFLLRWGRQFRASGRSRGRSR
jgi:lysozyme family protein